MTAHDVPDLRSRGNRIAVKLLTALLYVIVGTALGGGVLASCEINRAYIQWQANR